MNQTTVGFKEILLIARKQLVMCAINTLLLNDFSIADPIHPALLYRIKLLKSIMLAIQRGE